MRAMSAMKTSDRVMAGRIRWRRKGQKPRSMG